MQGVDSGVDLAYSQCDYTVKWQYCLLAFFPFEVFMAYVYLLLQTY
jgi:hypothetical protein